MLISLLDFVHDEEEGHIERFDIKIITSGVIVMIFVVIFYPITG